MSLGSRPLVIDPTRQYPLPQSPSGPPPYYHASPPGSPQRVVSSLLPMDHLSLSSPRSPPFMELPGTRRRDPGHFDSRLAGSENYAVPRSQYQMSPRRLNDPLDQIGGRYADIGGPRISMASDVSSLTPSEAEMLRTPNVDSEIDHSFESHHSISTGFRMETLPEEERFSNVPTIFDIAQRRNSNKAQTGHASIGSGQTSDPYFEVPGSYSTSSRPDNPTSPPAQLRNLGPAPILSFTAGAATGQEVISGNRTFEKSSVGSEETAQRKRHYEGCMLCSPLPSPSSSISSFCPDTHAFSSGELSSPGPPPNAPLPELLPQSAKSAAISPGKETKLTSEFNLLGSYLNLEDESAAYDSTRDEPRPVFHSTPVPSALLGDPGPDVYSSHPQALYTHPGHGGSLSTLLEGDEDSQFSQSRHPSQIGRTRHSQDAANRRIRGESGDISRPQTGGTSTEIPRDVPVHGNVSQNSLLAANSEFPISPPIPAVPERYGRNRNPFKRNSRPLSDIQEAGSSSKWSPWRGVFGKEDASISSSVLGTGFGNIELHPISDPPGRSISMVTALAGSSRPHPGQRRDQPGADGAYEVVNLSGPQINVGRETPDIQRQRDSGGAMLLDGAINRVKKLHCGLSPRNTKWLLVFLGVVAVLLMIVLPVLYIGLPSVAQKAVDNASLSITSLSITGAAPESVDLNMGVMLAGKSPFYLGPTNMRLSMKYSSKSHVKRDHTPTHYTHSKDGTLGYLQISRKAGNNSNDVRGGVTLSGNRDDRFFISDVTAWGNVMESLVFQRDGVEVQIEGEVNLNSGGLKWTCNLKKDVKFPGIGGFDIVVNKYNIFEKGRNFTVDFELESNSTILLDFGSVDFDLIFGLTLIGKATVDQFTVGPGINKFIAHGSISEEATVDDPELLGRFLTVLYIQTNKNPTTALSMAGANATIDGKTVGWLLPAIQRLKIPLPAVEGPQSSFISAFDMGLSLEMDGTQTSGRDGFITSNFSLPFSSKELQTIVKRVGHKLELSELGGSTFARLVTPLSPAGMKDGKLVVNFTNAVLVLTNRQDWSKGFLKPLIQSKNFMVSVSGNLTAEVETTLGNATVRDITLQNTSWNIFGYDGLSQGGKNPVSLESPKVMNNAGNGLQIQVKVVIEGSGGLKIKLGNVVFRTSYGSISRPIGNLTISAFALAKGRSNYDGVLTLDTIQSSQENVNAFMSGFFSGGGLPLVFDAPDASPDLEVSAALQGINIIATINSPGYPSFLRNLKVLYNPNTTSNQIFGAIEFFNPLDVEMQITGFNLTLKTVESGMDLGRLSATGSEALLPGIGKVFEYGISDHQLDVEGFKDYFRQDSSTEIEVEGYVQVDIAGEKTKLSVELKRLVSLVETKGSAE